MAEEQKQHPVDLYALVRGAFDAHAKVVTLASTLLAMSDAKIKDNAAMGEMLAQMMSGQAKQIEERDKLIASLKETIEYQAKDLKRFMSKRALDPLNNVVDAARVYVINRKHDGRDKHLNELIECMRALDMVESEDAPDRVDAAVG
jgi:predicted chitinase